MEIVTQGSMWYKERIHLKVDPWEHNLKVGRKERN